MPLSTGCPHSHILWEQPAGCHQHLPGLHRGWSDYTCWRLQLQRWVRHWLREWGVGGPHGWWGGRAGVYRDGCLQGLPQRAAGSDPGVRHREHDGHGRRCGTPGGVRCCAGGRAWSVTIIICSFLSLLAFALEPLHSQYCNFHWDYKV